MSKKEIINYCPVCGTAHHENKEQRKWFDVIRKLLKLIEKI